MPWPMTTGSKWPSACSGSVGLSLMPAVVRAAWGLRAQWDPSLIPFDGRVRARLHIEFTPAHDGQKRPLPGTLQPFRPSITSARGTPSPVGGGSKSAFRVAIAGCVLRKLWLRLIHPMGSVFRGSRLHPGEPVVHLYLYWHGVPVGEKSSIAKETCHTVGVRICQSDRS